MLGISADGAATLTNCNCKLTISIIYVYVYDVYDTSPIKISSKAKLRTKVPVKTWLKFNLLSINNALIHIIIGISTSSIC